MLTGSPRSHLPPGKPFGARALLRSIEAGGALMPSPTIGVQGGPAGRSVLDLRSEGGPLFVEFLLRIDGSQLEEPENHRWRYSWRELGKIGNGYDGFTIGGDGNRSTSTHGFAYNLCEQVHLAGFRSWGGFEDDLPGDFETQPCPDGMVRRAFEIRFDNGFREVWFEWQNQPYGTCDGTAPRTGGGGGDPRPGDVPRPDRFVPPFDNPADPSGIPAP